MHHPLRCKLFHCPTPAGYQLLFCNFDLQTCPLFDVGVHTLMSLRHRTRLRVVSSLFHFVLATLPTRTVSASACTFSLFILTRGECKHTAICTTLLFICDEQRDLHDASSPTDSLKVLVVDLKTTSSCPFIFFSFALSHVVSEKSGRGCRSQVRRLQVY